MANDRLYQAPVESVISPTSGKARTYQAPVESVISPTSGKARTYQLAVEAVYPSSNPTTVIGRAFVIWVGPGT